MSRLKRLVQLLFTPCDGISELVSESLDRDLTRTERFGVRLHLTYCRACRRFELQSRRLQELFATTEFELLDGHLKLSPESAARMIQRLYSL